MRKNIAIAVGGLLAIGAIAVGLQSRAQPASAVAGFQAAPTVMGVSSTVVSATGTLRSNQTAQLIWRTTGTVGEVKVKAGDQVSSGQELASLSPASLPPLVIRSQADLLNARKALDDLTHSTLQQAQAEQAVQQAQNALDDLKGSQMSEAQAQQAVAQTQKAVDRAELRVYTLIHPAPQEAVEQAHANLLLAENKLNKMQKQASRLERLLKKVPEFFKPRIRKALRGMQFSLAEAQLSYERQQAQYDRLQQPPDPNDLAVAQADLEQVKAKLADAQRNLERVKGGPTSPDVAAAEAKLADTQRAYARVQAGPNPDDLAAAQARVAAAEAALHLAQITAPFGGVITEVNSQPGDQVKTGLQAFRLDDLSRRLVDLKVSEVDINQIQVGQPAVITFDAVPGKEYHGKVTEVAPVGKSIQGVVSFRVTVELSDGDSLVKPGMTAAAEIAVQS